jgi:hypothetical protein
MVGLKVTNLGESVRKCVTEEEFLSTKGTFECRSESRVLRRIFGPKREEVTTRQWGKMAK